MNPDRTNTKNTPNKRGRNTPIQVKSQCQKTAILDKRLLLVQPVRRLLFKTERSERSEMAKVAIQRIRSRDTGTNNHIQEHIVVVHQGLAHPRLCADLWSQPWATVRLTARFVNPPPTIRWIAQRDHTPTINHNLLALIQPTLVTREAKTSTMNTLLIAHLHRKSTHTAYYHNTRDKEQGQELTLPTNLLPFQPSRGRPWNQGHTHSCRRH